MDDSRPLKRLRLGGGLTLQEVPSIQDSQCSKSATSSFVHPQTDAAVLQIAGDRLTVLANETWGLDDAAFRRDVVENIYKTELNGGLPDPPSLRRVMVLEVSQYLEKYLWPNFDPEQAVFAEILSAVLMVNEKFREGSTPWACFETRKVQWSFFPPRIQQPRLDACSQYSIL